MSERVLLMVGPRRRKAEGTVVGSDVLPRRYLSLSMKADSVRLLLPSVICALKVTGERSKCTACSLRARDHSQMGGD